MDTIVILTAFIAGLGFSKLGLPPLLGYLAAGFVLGVTGQVEGALLNSISELGITLLLFTIGLKLDVRSILLPRIWGVACTHMLITVVLVSLTLTLLSLTGVAALAELDWNSRLLLALAFSFSSTVFAVKVLDEQGDMNSLHGNTAIGILVIQDIIAVLYMVWLEGVLPQWYAAGLLLLILLRIPLIHLLKITGHNELLTLLGFALALGGYGLFEMAGLKGGVGALFLGIVIAGHSKSNELARNLMQFKELFLVGFFLTIGLNGLPDGEQWLLAMIFAIVGILFKPLLFILLFSRSHLKVRTSFLGAMALSNYSEFGLIVIATAIGLGVLAADWAVTFALSLALSFVFGTFLNYYKHGLYQRLHEQLARLKTDHHIEEQMPIDLKGSRFLVLGMGRTGTGAYDYLKETHGDAVMGVEERQSHYASHLAAGRNVLHGDATNMDFWERVNLDRIELILLTLTNVHEILQVASLVRQMGFKGQFGAVAHYDDEEELLAAQDIKSFNLYTGAGAGFAERISHLVGIGDKANG